MKILTYGDESLDRLSELPDSLIHHIVRLLPMNEVVRTSLLSTRWKNVWTTTPFLNFEDFTMGTNAERSRKFINWVLMWWRGMKIQKMKIDFGNHFSMTIGSDIDLWVDFAKKYGVEELHVDLGSQIHWAPQCFYSCSSLTTLHLRGCNLPIPTNNVKWNQLTCLSIEYHALSEELINKILSGSPKLESLSFVLWTSHENLTIQSNSLKYLYVCKYANAPNVYTELRISTPNLEMLELLYDPYSKCLMNNVPCLSYAKIFFCPTYYDDHYSLSYGWYSYVGETLRQILPTIQHVKELTLSDCCIKVLGDMKSKNMVLHFPNVWMLNLTGCVEEYEQIVRLLEIFPELGMLVLQQERASYGREPVKFEPNFPNSFLQQLRTIMITWDVGADSIFPFIEILLKYASKLEKMVFQVGETTPPSNSFLLQLASQKVLKMPRSSPTAELIFNMI